MHSAVVYLLLAVVVVRGIIHEYNFERGRAVMTNALRDTDTTVALHKLARTEGGRSLSFPGSTGLPGLKKSVVENTACGYMYTLFEGAQRKQREANHKMPVVLVACASL